MSKHKTENGARGLASRPRTGTTNGEPPLAADPVAQTDGRLKLLVLVVLTLLLLALTALVAYPFLPALTWAVALAIIAWPLHAWLSRRIARPNLAASISTTLVAVIVLTPGIWLAYQLAGEAGNAANHVQNEQGAGELQARAAEVPGLGRVVAWADKVGLNVEAQARRAAASLLPDFNGFAQGSLNTSVQFLVAFFVLFFLFRDRSLFLRGFRDLLPLSREEEDRIMQRAADSVHANLYATVITSAVDAIGGGLMFWLLGLPSPVLWGFVIFVLSVLPVVGAAIIWGPAAIYLAMNGQPMHAAGMLGWGLLCWAIVDNLLYVRIAGNHMQMHPVPTMIAFLGGIGVFGISGMILGPAILAVTLAILEFWQHRRQSALA